MPWWIWLIVAGVLGIIEVSTFTFVLLWIAVGAVITAVLSPVVPSAWGQLLLFAVVSLILFLATRPLARKWKAQRKYVNPVESLVGKKALVVNGAVPGRLATVRVDSQMWSAVSDDPLVEGAYVIIVDSRSTVLHVSPDGLDLNGEKGISE